MVIKRDDILSHVLNAMGAPFIGDCKHRRHIFKVLDDKDNGISREDMRALSNFVNHLAQVPKQTSKSDYTKLLKTFWYICNVVVSTEIKGEEFCRQSILNALSLCNNLAIMARFDNGEIGTFAVLGGLFGKLYSDITHHCQSIGCEIPSSEMAQFTSTMECISRDNLSYCIKQCTKPTLHHQLKWLKWNILDKVQVHIQPNSEIIALFLEYGANPQTKNIMGYRAIEELADRFLDYVNKDGEEEEYDSCPLDIQHNFIKSREYVLDIITTAELLSAHRGKPICGTDHVIGWIRDVLYLNEYLQ